MITKLTAVVFACATAYAGTVYTTPPGLTPGTQYQLVFLTSETFLATSSSISDYNADVTSAAALDSALSGFTWTDIGSTTAVNANVNAPSTGLVFTLDGVEVASSGLYGGSILSPIDIDENGNLITNGDVWTGSLTGGTAAGGINDLGQTFPAVGYAGATNGSWIQSNAAIESNNGLFLYALSEVITVPPASSVPEPGTAALLLFFLASLAPLRAKIISRKTR